MPEPDSVSEETDPGVPERLYVRIHNPDDHDLLKALQRAVSKHSGDTSVIVVLDGAHRQAIKLPFGIAPTDTALSALRSVLPEKDIVLQ